MRLFSRLDDRVTLATPDDWHPSARKREAGADRQRGEKAVERGDIHVVARRCVRLEESLEFVDFLIRERRIQQHPHHLNPTTSRVGSFALSSLLSRSHEGRKVMGCPNETCVHNIPPRPGRAKWARTRSSILSIHRQEKSTGRYNR